MLFKYAIRTLLKNPGFSLVAVLTLTLGIGANTAIFSVVDHLLLRPLPYPEPEQLVTVVRRFTQGGIGEDLNGPEYRFVQENSPPFESNAVLRDPAGYNFTGRNGAQRVQGRQVTQSYFTVLGVQPNLGRNFLSEEDLPGGPSAVILSYGFWFQAFGGSADILGQQITLNDKPYNIVGVMSQNFSASPSVDLWIAAQFSPDDPLNGGQNFQLVGRLKNDMPMEFAQSEIERISAQFRAAYPQRIQSNIRGLELVSYQEVLIGMRPFLRPALLILFGAVGLVLLIACANVANLLLGRAAGRRKEVAIRSALGAGVRRLGTQLLAESVILAAAGGLAALVFAYWLLQALIAFGPESLPDLQNISLDLRVLAFTIFVSVFTGIAFGAVETLQVRRIDPNAALKEFIGVGQSVGRRRASSALVVAEVALSAGLLIGAALMIMTFVNLQRVSLGFEADNLLTVELPLSSSRYASPVRTANFERELRDRLRSVPGVVSVASGSTLPLEQGYNLVLTAEDRPELGRLYFEYRVVSPEYFRTLEIPLISGREFQEADAQNSPPVAIVNETLARVLATERTVVGQRITLGKDFGVLEEPVREIIGVTGDVTEINLRLPANPTVYVVREQAGAAINSRMNQSFPAAGFIRTSGPLNLTDQVRLTVAAMDTAQPVSRIRWMTEVAVDSIATNQFLMLLMSTFAVMALALTVIGLYGVLAYDVVQRTGEIGLRMALGANHGAVLRMVLRRGMTLAGLGLLLGLGVAYGLTGFLAMLLFGISPTDTTTFAGITLLLFSVAFLACYIPARRATQVDPMVALRHE